jgi:3-isopropylmalate dehydrogenase
MTMTERTLYLLPGDGIGPEIMAEVRRVAEWLNELRNGRFAISEGLLGGCALDRFGVPLPDETTRAALAADAVIFGAAGGPRWANVAPHLVPEGHNGLLRLRREMQLFAKICPLVVHDALVDGSSLKREKIQGLDMVVVREIYSGIYFGEPRAIEDLPDGTQRGVNTEVYTTPEVTRVARIACQLARERTRRLCSVDKANVLESSRVWRSAVERVHREEFPDVELSHMYVDNAAIQLIRSPKQFDVLQTTNMFGDILSDESAGLVGSLGMLPTAELGEPNERGNRRALYQAVHGSAPDIAGMNVANPIGTILSFALALRYTFDMAAEARLVEAAVNSVLDAGLRTGDIMQPGMRRVSTTAMGEAIVAAMDGAAQAAAGLDAVAT